MSFWSQTFLLIEQQMHNSLKGSVIYINGGAKNSPLGRGQIWALITSNSCLIRAKFITVLERGSWPPPPHPAYEINGWSARGYIVGDVLHILSDIRSTSNSCSSDCLFTVCICNPHASMGLYVHVLTGQLGLAVFPQVFSSSFLKTRFFSLTVLELAD